ncbi:MAG TPA: hypothetical protein VGR97_00975 [Candidatus Acidoferrales bacterium]|nr:hypothetical protein [Candidatus Acidoferrales bacterium]
MKSQVSSILIVLGLLLISPATSAQKLSKVGAASPLDTRMPDFTLDDKSILTGVRMLEKESLGIHFGFEEILTHKFSDPKAPYPKITVRLEHPTARDVLDALCAADPRYMWSDDGNATNIYPRATVGDPSYLLNRELEVFQVQDITQIDQGLLAIVRQLPPPVEQVAHVQIGGGSGEYPPVPWTAVFNNITVRQALNRLVAHVGPNALWVFYGSQEFREFAFCQGPAPHKIRVNVEH